MRRSFNASVLVSNDKRQPKLSLAGRTGAGLQAFSHAKMRSVSSHETARRAPASLTQRETPHTIVVVHLRCRTVSKVVACLAP